MAAACSETEAERDEGEGDSPRTVVVEAEAEADSVGAPVLAPAPRLPFVMVRRGTATGDDSGSEFKSGAMSVADVCGIRAAC